MQATLGPSYIKRTENRGQRTEDERELLWDPYGLGYFFCTSLFPIFRIPHSEFRILENFYLKPINSQHPTSSIEHDYISFNSLFAGDVSMTSLNF